MKIIIKNPNPTQDIRVRMSRLSTATVDILNSIGAVYDDKSELSFCLTAYKENEIVDAIEQSTVIQLGGEWLLEIDSSLYPRVFTLLELQTELSTLGINMSISAIQDSQLFDVYLTATTQYAQRIRFIKTATSQLNTPVLDESISVKEGYVDFYLWCESVIEPHPEKPYLVAREEYDASVTLLISDWKTTGAWEFSIDGEPYYFNDDETLYDALVNLYNYNVTYPHRTDELYGPETKGVFNIYNNNAHLITLYFKYVGSLPDPIEDLLTVEDTYGGTNARIFDESKSLEIELAGSKYGYINQSPLFNVEYNGAYLISGNFYILTINGVEYKYTGPLADLYQYNWDGLEALLTIHPELIDLVDISSRGEYVSISNKTSTVMVVNIRLDRNMPYTNGVEEVWSKENPKGIYLPTVPEIPSDDEDLQFYPFGIIQERNSVPVTVTEQGYSFELAPSLPEPLTLDINYTYEFYSITRDSVNLSGQVNYSDARISLTWQGVEYVARVDRERSNGKYNWVLEELPYDLFEMSVIDNTDNTNISLTMTAETTSDMIVRDIDIVYYKTTFIKFKGNGAPLELINFSGTSGDVVRYPDGTVLNINTSGYTRLKNDTNEITIIELTGNRPYDSVISLSGQGVVEVIELPRHKRITGLRFANLSYAAFPAVNLTKVPDYLPETITNLSNAFLGCERFKQDISMWDTSNVTNMYRMFYNAIYFSHDLNNWDVSNVTDMSGMFGGYSRFNGDISTWNTSRVTTMSRMFYNAIEFNQPIGNWDVSQVTDMTYMFNQASMFDQDISLWNVSNVTNMTGMFYDATAFNQNLNNWNVSSVTDMSIMFRGATAFNQPIGNWDTSSVTTMSTMFYDAIAFDQPIGNWNTSNVVNMTNVFAGALVFNRDISKWDTSKVTTMNQMFLNARAFNQPLNDWDTSSVTIMRWLFFRAETFNQPLNSWQVDNVNDMSYMFNGAKLFNGDISSWDTSNVTDMQYMFAGLKMFDCDISNWDVSNVTNMESMFAGNSVFDADISSWDTSKVTIMSNIFSGAYAFNADISVWDVSKVTNMHGMFYETQTFNQPIGKWNVSNVTDMGNMFYKSTAFKQDLSQWCVSKITIRPAWYNINTADPDVVKFEPVWGTCPRGENLT